MNPRIYRWIDGFWQARPIGESTSPARSPLHGKILLTDDPDANHTSVRDAQLHPRLFIEFAELKSPEAILAFAKKHGPLGNRAQRPIVDGRTRAPNGTYGEPLLAWLSEIQDLRVALEIGAAWENSDTERLKGWFTRRGRDYYFNDGSGERELVSRAASPKLLTRLGTGDVLVAAEYYLTSLVNRKLWYAVAAGLVWGRGPDPFLFRFIPHDLLAYLWLQFALSAGGRKRVRSCEFCGRWMLIEPPGRSTRKTCSDTCRQKHHQRLKRDEHLKKAAIVRKRCADSGRGHNAKRDALK
jgi:hypothetical protein